jgi:hypothetical protein
VRSSPMAQWGFLALFFLAAGFSLPAFLLGEVEKVCTSPHRETVLPAGVIHENTNFAVLVSSGAWASCQANVVDIREESSVRAQRPRKKAIRRPPRIHRDSSARQLLHRVPYRLLLWATGSSSRT